MHDRHPSTSRGPRQGHAHGHAHGHTHVHGTASGAQRRRLAVVLGLTLGVLGVEVVGGVLSGSLALLADAGHMATDALGIALALGAVSLAQRPAAGRRTFGWQRLEVLSAVANGLLLLGVAVYVLVEAVGRIGDPPDIASGLMLWVAVAGLVVNLVCLEVLRRGRGESLTLRGAYLEVAGDALGSVAVIVAALVIATTGWTPADVLASVVVGFLVLPRAWSLLREALDVLLEAAPRGVDLEDVRRHVLGVPDVIGVHDLHAWTITSGLPVLSAHVVVTDAALDVGHGGRVLDALGACLGSHFDVAHCTFQLESPGHRTHEAASHD
ncbi:cation diffusion facilitator family transporter [Modestobacter sp. I12A-02628]|uniref:Cation transporter n=1 Tax=Goekera deserti TaxID=2497753 RepID=A0A7K3WD98_9ACTN|nr:cation diffusion facilitator family transporter [Goekera deserti]NDI48160.1 cation diffusion facilitator family transporter [Goekera deserti]NEL53909.1 cation transporter [Goekera deserti]